MAINQAATPWRALTKDVTCLGIGTAAMIICFVIDVRSARVDWFAPSGAIAVLFGGYVAYRSLGKHYQKFLNAWRRGEPLATSPNQRVVDRTALILTVVGTLVWAYGDKLLVLWR